MSSKSTYLSSGWEGDWRR